MASINWPTNGSLLIVGSCAPDDPVGAYQCALQRARTVLTAGSVRNEALFNAKTHPDFYEVSPEAGSARIKVDDIRALIEWCAGSPQIATKKVVLVSPAHALNLQAANALLKTLEEPSLETLLLLVTDKPAFIPATVRSRCFWIRLPGSQLAETVLPWVGDLKKDLEALRIQHSDPVTLGTQWLKHNPKEVMDALLHCLYEEASSPNVLQLPRNKQWWAFFDKAIQAKRSVEESNTPNTQLLLESLFIEYLALY